MPELPEVQTVVTGLGRVLPGKQIGTVEVFWNRTIATPSVDLFVTTLSEKTITNLSRRAKFIVVTFKDDSVLLVHLRMSGQLFFRQKAKPENDSALRVRFHFSDDSLLDFNDFRKFGKMYWHENLAAAETTTLANFGPDALDISAIEFIRQLGSKKGNIKALLLRQDLVSGVGNIYADEALFAAGIHPLSQSSQIPSAKLEDLHRVLQEILNEAIRLRGTTMRNYLDVNGRAGQFRNFLKVYKNQGKKCPNCEGTITKIRVAGRGTHVCEECQRKY